MKVPLADDDEGLKAPLLFLLLSPPDLQQPERISLEAPLPGLFQVPPPVLLLAGGSFMKRN